MNGLIDLILENPFFLIILIGGIISLLKGKSEKVEEDQPATNRPKTAQAENPFERSRQRERTRSAEKVRTEPISSKSIEELREEQMMRFSGQVDSEEDQEEKDTDKVSDRVRKEVVGKKITNRHKKEFRNDFNQSLTKKGLVNSVIMAEVLGAPRARKPYETVITKRRKR